jgi:hypothetical protein
MIKGKSLVKQVVTFLAVLFLLLFVLQGLSQAKSSSTDRHRQVSTTAIAEDKLPWPGTPWLIGAVLTAGTIAVSLKSAKKTHMD